MAGGEAMAAARRLGGQGGCGHGVPCLAIGTVVQRLLATSTGLPRALPQPPPGALGAEANPWPIASERWKTREMAWARDQCRPGGDRVSTWTPPRLETVVAGKRGPAAA